MSVFLSAPEKKKIILRVKPLRKQRTPGVGEGRGISQPGNVPEDFHVTAHLTASELLNYVSEQVLYPWDFW